MWPNETAIWNTSANSINRAPDRILDRNQFIDLRRRPPRSPAPARLKISDDKIFRNETHGDY